MVDIDLLTGLPGLRDFYPEDWEKISYVLGKMRSVAETYGYFEYEGPSLEQVELIEAKSGEGLIKEIFQLIDRNDKRLLLRPEQTPTLARMLAKEQQRYKRPLRWYSIPRLFRDETVQKGRVKEFWQLNVDILGEESVVADAETIAVAVDIIRACGIKDDEFMVYVNHRELLNNYITSICDIDPQEIIPLIDKKMSFLQEAVEKTLLDRGEDEQIARENALLIRRIVNSSGEFKERLLEDLDDNLSSLLSSKDELIESEMSEKFQEKGLPEEAITSLLHFISLSGKPEDVVMSLEAINLPASCDNAVSELKQLAIFLEAFNVNTPIVYDTSMARGLDYYTGIVYEGFDSTGEIVRAIFGGGRYADLVEAVGGAELSGVGFGMGELVLLELMHLRSTFPQSITQLPDIYLAPIKDDPVPDLIRLSQELKKDFRVISNPFSWKLKRHFALAEERGAKLVILLGQRDIDQNVVSVRIMENGEQRTLPRDENLATELRNLLADL